MRSRRLALVALTAMTSLVGVWALVWPASFYGTFPLGRAWVSLDGPYNEHLVRDVGGLYLALTVVTGVAAWRLEPTIVRLAAAASLATAVPHLAYHALHLEGYTGADAVANLLTLSTGVVIPAWLAWSPAPPAASPHATGDVPAIGARR